MPYPDARKLRGEPMHPSVSSLLRFFEYDHLPMHLQRISQPFCTLAHEIAYNYEGPEVGACLRKLLEAKDCAVRAALVYTDRTSGVVNEDDRLMGSNPQPRPRPIPDDPQA